MKRWQRRQTLLLSWFLIFIVKFVLNNQQKGCLVFLVAIYDLFLFTYDNSKPVVGRFRT